MTLKEAKRAYKKEGHVVRYTASQMARADRIDEKRKKALDKERQRIENKRKRDEKEERERKVRQKMLEEGRLKVEDTWGKVTASQPRLNRFFGPNAVAAPAKNDLETEDNALKGDNLGDEVMTGDEEAEDGQDASQETKPPVVPGAVQGLSRPTASVPSPAQHQQQERNLTSPPKAGQIRSFPSFHGQRTPLRALEPSHYNARSPAQAESADATKITQLNKPARTPRNSPYNSRHDIRPYPKVVGTSGAKVLCSLGSSTLSDGSPTELLPIKKNLEQIGARRREERTEHESLPSKEPTAKDGEEKLISSTEVVNDDEDFTDGLDDEAFLLLCATQQLAQPKPDEQAVVITKSKSPPRASGTDDRQYSSRRCEPAVKVVMNHDGAETKCVGPTNALTESFNSVFSELEDDDLIALADQVEADLATPKQTLPMSSTHKVGKAISPSLAQEHPCNSFRTLTRSQPSPPQKTRATAAQTPSCLDRDWGIVGKQTSRCLPVTGSHPGATGSTARQTVSRRRGKDSKAISWPRHHHLPHPTLQGAESAPPVVPSPAQTESKPKRNGRYPWVVHPYQHEDEFDVPDLDLGPSTQALTLELLERVEAQIGQGKAVIPS